MESDHSLNAGDVTRIAREAAHAQSPDLVVLGVSVTDGDSDYAEIIIDLKNCRREPCRLAVGVFRNAEERELRNQIADKIQRHLREHH